MNLVVPGTTTSAGLTLTGDLSMVAYDIDADDITCDTVTVDNLNLNGNTLQSTTGDLDLTPFTFSVKVGTPFLDRSRDRREGQK